MKESFASRLHQAMTLRNLKSSQIEKISEQLYNEGKINKTIKMPLITDYLKGRYEAKQSNIYALSLILNVDEAWLMGAYVPMERKTTNAITMPQFDKNTLSLIENYNKLNELGKKTADNYVEGLTELPKYTEKNELSEENTT